MKKQPITYQFDESLGHLSNQFSRAILKRITQELSVHGYAITPEQWTILVHVWDQNGQPQYVLADKLFKDKTTIARVVAGTEALGLIRREPGPTDAREKIVYMTEKGKKVMEEITPIIHQILGKATDGIDAEQLKICKDVLRRAHANLVKY